MNKFVEMIKANKKGAIKKALLIGGAIGVAVVATKLVKTNGNVEEYVDAELEAASTVEGEVVEG